MKNAVHSNVFFKVETGLLNLHVSSNSHPWLLGHSLEGLWGAAFLLVLCTGGVGCGIKEWRGLHRALLEK